MSKIKDISSESIEVIQLINKDNLYKKVKVYKYGKCKAIYCITHYDTLQISASTPYGPADKEDLIYIFSKLTKKPIENFRFMKTNRASYLLENKHNYLN